MPHVAFVAPTFMENTTRYAQAFASLPGVSLSLISQSPPAAVPDALRRHVSGFAQVHDVGDGSALARAVAGIQRLHGPVDRLTAALEQLQLPLALAREALDLPGMHSEGARRFRDKDRMKDVLRAQGVPVAASALVHSSAELRAFVRKVGLPIIVKPQAGLGARATHRVESEADLDALERIGMVPSARTPVQAEQFIRAREHTCETVTINGRVVWRSGTRYFPTPLEALETPWMQYCVLLPREVDEPWTRFAPVNDAALRALWGSSPGPAGTALTHMEWFLRDDGSMLVSEVGARPPGVQIMPLMSLAHGTDMVARWAELIAFDRFTPIERRWAAGAAFLRGHGKGTQVASVKGVDRAIERAGSALMELKVPKVGQPRNTSYEGEGWATVRHATTEGVKQALL
ncbi:MAG: ATP-grasp domain-containing protein, partial [Archangium sp.]|nr:ATP-grasp domain-containing protein [Archangium sp.]